MTIAAEPAAAALSSSARTEKMPAAAAQQATKRKANVAAPPAVITATIATATTHHHHQYASKTTGLRTINTAISAARLPQPPPQQPRPEWDDDQGHYIIKPGDQLSQRYKILKLLGQGTYGRVVHCWDRTLNTQCAVKIIKAIPKYREAAKLELKALQTLKLNDPSGENGCIPLKHAFDYRDHICMVFGLLSCSLYDFAKRQRDRAFPMSHVQSFGKQLLKSVVYMHRLTLVHTDLKPENIMLVDDDAEEVRLRQWKRPRRQAASGAGASSASATSSSTDAATSVRLRNTEIRLIDFGSTIFNNEYHSSVVSTRHYRAPEIILGQGWSFPCDMWSLGCILYELATGKMLFQTHDDLEHLAIMERVLGPFSASITEKHFKQYRSMQSAAAAAAAEQAIKSPQSATNGGKSLSAITQQSLPTSPKDSSIQRWPFFAQAPRTAAGYKVDFPRDATKHESRRFVSSMKRVEQLLGGMRVSVPDRDTEHEIRAQFIDLLKRLLDHDQNTRISAKDAAEHPFFQLYIEEEFDL